MVDVTINEAPTSTKNDDGQRDRHDGPALGSRAVALASPMLQVLDVRLAQPSLSSQGTMLCANEIIGTASHKIVCVDQALQRRTVNDTLDASDEADLAAKVQGAPSLTTAGRLDSRLDPYTD